MNYFIYIEVDGWIQFERILHNFPRNNNNNNLIWLTMLKANHRIIETLFDRGGFLHWKLLFFCEYINTGVSESNLEWKDDFYFVQAADTQFGQFDRMGGIDRDQLLNGKLPWYREVQLAERAVTLINQLDPKPRFMIICGDMLDNFFYELLPEIEDRIFTDKLDPVRDQQFDSFMKVFSKLDQCIPLICVCGNHDVGDSPNQQVNTIRQYFQKKSNWQSYCVFVFQNSS